MTAYLEVQKRFRLFIGLLLSVLLPAVAFAAQPKAKWAGAPTKPLSRQVGLDFKTLFRVVELEESARHARLRIVARVGPSQVFGRLGAALGSAWVRQPTPAAGRGVWGSLTSFPRATGYRAHYLAEGSSRLLHVTLQPVGRSNLFRLELRLSPVKRTP